MSDATVARTPAPALLRAELLKISTTRMWLGLLIGVVLFVILQVVSSFFGAIASNPQGPQVPGLETDAGVRNLFAGAGASYLFALVLGILGMTQEYRFQTVTGTFLAAPHRLRVVVAKMGAYALAGAAYALVGIVAGYLTAYVLLAFKDHASLSAGTLLAIAGGAVLGSALYAVLGVAVGTLVRNQIAAILGALVFVLLVEALLVAFLPSWGKWLPGGALNGVLQATGINSTAYLPVWGGALLLLAYAAVIGGLAAATTLRRDIS